MQVIRSRADVCQECRSVRVICVGCLVLGEFTFVLCSLGTEVIRYVTRSRVRRFERFAHSIPERRYLSRFYAPLNNVLAVTFRSREQLAYGGWLNRCTG